MGGFGGWDDWAINLLYFTLLLSTLFHQSYLSIYLSIYLIGAITTLHTLLYLG